MPNTTEKPIAEDSGKPDNEKKEETKIPPPTPEELDEIIKANVDFMFGDSKAVEKKKEPVVPEAKKEEKKEEEKPQEEKPPEKPAEKPAAPAAPVVEALKPKPRVLADDEINEVADRVADRMQQPKEPPKSEVEVTKDPFAEFDPVDRTQLEALSFLSKNDPRFKGRDLASETKRFWEKEQAYITAWEKKHDGDKFNPEDAEHSNFYRTNEPSGISDSDIETARVDMRVAQAVQQVERKFEKKTADELEQRIAPIERDKIMERAGPAIGRSVNDAVSNLAAQVLPDVVGEAGLTKEVADKIMNDHPAEFQLLSREAALLNVQVSELEAMRHLGNQFQFDEEKTVQVELPGGRKVKIKPHAEILNAAEGLEEKIMDLPVQERSSEGRQFIRRADRAREVQAIQSGRFSPDPVRNRAEKERRMRILDDRTWSIGLDDIRFAFVANSAERIKDTMAIVKNGAKPTEKKKEKKDEKPVNGEVSKTTDKVGSKPPPALGGESDLATTKQIPGSGGAPQSEVNAKWAFDS